MLKCHQTLVHCLEAVKNQIWSYSQLEESFYNTIVVKKEYFRVVRKVKNVLNCRKSSSSHLQSDVNRYSLLTAQSRYFMIVEDFSDANNCEVRTVSSSVKMQRNLIFRRINEAYGIEIKGTFDIFQFDIEYQVLWQPDN